MKPDGVTDASQDKDGRDSPIPIRRGDSDQWPSVLKKLLDDREVEIDDLRSTVQMLERDCSDQRALRQQSEQSLARTRQRLRALLDQKAEHLEQSEETKRTLEELKSSVERVALLEGQVADLLNERRALESKVAELNEWTFRLSADRRAAEDISQRTQRALTKQAKTLELANAEIGALKSEVRALQAKLLASEETRGEAYGEIAAITRLLRASEALTTQQDRRLEWLNRIAAIAFGNSRWWHGLLPHSIHRKLVFRRLAAERLFDADAYLTRYPDVRHAKTDPLRHYILHGMTEGRRG